MSNSTRKTLETLASQGGPSASAAREILAHADSAWSDRADPVGAALADAEEGVLGRQAATLAGLLAAKTRPVTVDPSTVSTPAFKPVPPTQDELKAAEIRRRIAAARRLEECGLATRSGQMLHPDARPVPYGEPTPVEDVLAVYYRGLPDLSYGCEGWDLTGLDVWMSTPAGDAWLAAQG